MKDGALPRSEKQVQEDTEQVRKFEKLVQSVKDNIGLSDIESKLVALGEQVRTIVTEVGNTNQTINQIIPHINRWIQIETQANTAGTVGQGTATVSPNNSASLLSSLPSQQRIALVKDVLQGLGEGLKGLAEVYKTFKGEPPGFLNLPEETIKKNLTESIMGDFETGRALRETINSGLKKKVVNKIIDRVVSDTTIHTL